MAIRWVKECILLISCQFLIVLHLYSQSSLTGSVIDEKDSSGLIGVNILLRSKSDTTVWKGTVTDFNGSYTFENIIPGEYIMKATFIGYKNYLKQLSIEASLRFDFKLEQDVKVLNEVEVLGTQIRAVQKGDTTEYNANAYKTNPDANVEDLVRKMPGITVENGTVKSQGEDVKKVLVDGQEFFGEDATLALRNLPSEIVDKIQVFDQVSEQSQFTGFDDGDGQKTINIQTKAGKNNGQFGKVYAGYGTKNTYLAGGNVNVFKGRSRLSLIGMINNINQQNFSSQDLIGVIGQSGNRRGGGGRRGRGNNAGDFLIGQQGGVNKTNSFGLNYSDVWGARVKLTGSYFFNNSSNISDNVLARTYFLSDSVNQLYDETNYSESKNSNHRFNLRFEYSIDTFNSIIVTPRVGIQNNRFASLLNGETSIIDTLLSGTISERTAQNLGLNVSNSILYRHKFRKDRRTFSLNIETQLNKNDGENRLSSGNRFYQNTAADTVFSQLAEAHSDGYSIGSRMNYTEPIGKTGMLQLSYNPSYRKSDSQKETRKRESGDSNYSILDSLLSNRFDNTVITHNGGVSYRIREEKLNLMIGANYQYLWMYSDQSFPKYINVNKYFNNILPNGMLNYKFSQTRNLRISYRTRTQTPSIGQLQNVVDNTNPLLLSAGSPNLRQEYAHTLMIRYGNTKTSNARSFLAFINAAYTQNYIGNSTFIAYIDTLIQDGVALYKGSQLSRPINLDGYWNVRTFFTLGLPVKLIKSNLNINVGGGYTRTPGKINRDINFANTYNFNTGVVVGSNISEKIDFTLSYTANYNIVENTIQPQLNNNYYSHNSSFKINWLPWKGLLLNSDLNNYSFLGLGNGFNQDIWLWNVSVGYKFLKNNAAEFRLTAFDVLNQNNNIQRNVTETYVEDLRTQVLNRYFMLIFTYNIRNFKMGK